MKLINAITTSAALILSAMIGDASAQAHCNLSLNIKCTVLDGRNHGNGTPCHQYNPCNNGEQSNCRKRNVRYDFEYKNENSETLRLDTESVTTRDQSTAKIRGQVIINNKHKFRNPLPSRNTSKFTITEWNENVCEGIPSANLHLIGNIVRPGTKQPHPNFKVCKGDKDLPAQNFQHLSCNRIEL